MIDLTGRAAVVTGASRGIGRATALRLARAGADVVVNFLTSQSAATQVAEEISKLGRRAVTVRADISQPEDVASMIEFVAQEFGRIDFLVSNAASGGFRNLMDATPANFAAAMNTNAQALLLLTQASLPLMRHNGPRRKIVALSSHGSHRALPAYGLIGASKAALESLVRHLAMEIGDQGINVNTLLAGVVETDSTRNFPGSQQMFEQVAQRRRVSGLPLSAEAVADAVLFLVSPLADLVQGQTIIVDGGECLHG